MMSMTSSRFSGFMGHGFMMAPVIGKLMAQYIVEGTELPMFDRWNCVASAKGRFAK